MAQAIETPEISEFAFGYVMTFSLSTMHNWPGVSGWTPLFAPYMPTQIKEKVLGIDVALCSQSTSFCLQYKRSRAVVRAHGNLIEPAYWDKIGVPMPLQYPFYRVQFKGSGDREQRETLAGLEADFSAWPDIVVAYAAPCFHTYKELDQVYRQGMHYPLNGNSAPRSAAVMFKASDFDLPDGEDHHISFDGIHPFGFRHSEEVKTLGVSKIAELAQVERGRLAERAPILRKVLDRYATKKRFGQVRSEMTLSDILRFFGYNPIGRRPAPDELSLFLSRGLESTDVDLTDDEAAVAARFRSLLQQPVGFFSGADVGGETPRSILDVITDLFVADQRAIQLIGSPILTRVTS
ncbi:hypothetical protein [Caenispirillum salinarum]|uniref:hypothetical protein n=1 Tax=Caenispirillum salinarum TaxID=859058 RepID=UPI00384D0C46